MLSGIAVLWGYEALPSWISKRVEECVARDWRTPLDTGRRTDWNSLLISRKGRFMAERTAYAHLDVHLHTGVDLQNRFRGGSGEPVYAVAKGKVCDVKLQAQGTRVTIAHLLADGEVVHTSYIHVADVRVKKGMRVSAESVIARRFNRAELRQYGKIYNHLHFQVHKKQFVPEHTVNSRTRKEVAGRFHDPEQIFRRHAQDAGSDWQKWVRSGKISFWTLLWLVLPWI